VAYEAGGQEGLPAPQVEKFNANSVFEGKLKLLKNAER